MKAKTMKNLNLRRNYGGFTMVELLIAIVIIGILTAIIVPVLSNRAADARIAAAKADMEAIANAQSQAALDTGYIYRLHVLDDSGAVGDGVGNGAATEVVDSIRDEDVHTDASQPYRIFLDAKTGIVLPDPAATTMFNRVENNPENFGWRGPYVNYHRKLSLTASAAGSDWVSGAPLDPWGNPYFLFVGGLSDGTGNTGGWIDERAISGNGEPSATFTYQGSSSDATGFDRHTLLSLGPDGLPGSATNPTLGSGDDLIRAF